MSRVLKRIANSPALLIATFLVTQLSAALAYSLLEGTDLIDSVYWALVTSTTLGYGDFSPHSTGGKILTSILISFTVFIMIPTITANVASWLIVNRDAFTHEEQEQIKDGVNAILARLDSRD